MSSSSGFFRLAPFTDGEDRDAAPAAFKGPGGARPWTWRRARQNLIWVYAFGLVFLVFPVVELTAASTPRAALTGAALIAAIGAVYLLAAWISDTSLRTRWCFVAGFLLLLVGSIAYWGWSFANYGVYVAVLLAALVPWRQARVALPVWGLILLGVAAASQTLFPAVMALIGVSVGLAMGGGIESGRVASRLSRAEQRVSVLAVAAERERIGRDLHDILGHSLTAISIKSDLAVRLVDQDPVAAKAQLGEINDVARQALADVRATASGFRQTRVATEVASARSVLMAAGIEARVPTAIEPLGDQVSELFGYVVREAVTNVVRHSEATTCTIAVGATAVSVTDDGQGFHERGSGSGLDGLTERVAAARGQLLVESTPGRGTCVRATVVATPSGDTPAGSAALAQ